MKNKIFIRLLTIIVITLFSFGAGIIVTELKIFPYNEIIRAKKVFTRNFGHFLQNSTTVKKERFSSIFINLEGLSKKIPKESKGYGGALTTSGNVILLITHEGRIFSARDVNSVKLTSIAPPKNYLREYVELSKTAEFKSYEHRFDRIRYNDILAIKKDEKHLLLVSYTRFNSEEVCYNNTISLLELNDVDSFGSIYNSEDWQILYESKPCLPLKREYSAIEGHMAGGRMAFDQKETIYLASGEYSWDGVYSKKAIAQNEDYEYGKVISINIRSGKSSMLTKGQRNMQGITIDSSGRLWTLEHGAKGGDELNLIEQGADYGFPSVTLGTLYTGLPFPNTKSFGRHDGYKKPIWAWLPSIGVSSLNLIDGFHQSWDGDLIAGSLVDGSLHRIRITGNRALFAERIHIGDRIRYVQVHQGKLIIWTDSNRLYFMEANNNSSFMDVVDLALKTREIDKDLTINVKAQFSTCMECHSLDPTENVKSPSLSLVYGNESGNTPFENYSSALRNSGFRWTESRLMKYLTDPTSVVPGTLMPNTDIGDREIVKEIVYILKELRTRARPDGTGRKTVHK